MNIKAILLAAGAGSRFGGDKLLHPLSDGIAIGVHAARNLIAAGLDVVAVVKPGDDPLARLLDGEGCRVSVCEHAARGMGASLAHGVQAVPDADAWIVALADMPSIRKTTLAAVINTLEAGKDLVAPSYQGRRGHPVGFGKRFGPQLARLDGDSGARDLVAAHDKELVLIDCDDPGVLLDIDRRIDIAS